MSNVSALPGCSAPTSEPNAALIDALEKLVAMAKSGQLQCYIGCGFTNDGLRVSTWCDFHDDKYQMLGNLEWLKSEYIHRHT